MPQHEWNMEEMRNAAIDNIIYEINQIDSKDARTFEVCIKEYLKEQYHVCLLYTSVLDDSLAEEVVASFRTIASERSLLSHLVYSLCLLYTSRCV